MPFWPFRHRCLIDIQKQAWVDERMEWLAGQFGRDIWLKSPVIEPTVAFFPDEFDASAAAAQRMLERICGYMKVDPARVALRPYAEGAHRKLREEFGVASDGSGSAGHYRVEGKEIIGVKEDILRDPLALAATLAHELAHVRLLGEGRLTGEEKDHEPLTDLATVFFGMGIFNANTAFRFAQYSDGDRHGWRASSIGYLREETFGHALAVYALARGETRPAWARHLQLNPRTYLKRGMKCLRLHPLMRH